MTYPHGGAGQIWRDGTAGAYNPKKSEIRSWGDALEQAVSALQARDFTAPNPKAPVELVATANIALSGEQIIDGQLTATSRVLVIKQTDAAQNGIYVTDAGAWVRAGDAATGAEIAWATVFVEGGLTQAGTQWICAASGVTLDVDDLPWVQMGDGGALQVAVSAIAPRVDALDWSARRQRYLAELAEHHHQDRPKCLIVVLLGQSLNVPRGAVVLPDAPPGVTMPVGGMSVSEWGFWSLNVEHVGHWDELASVVTYQEGSEQSPGAGIAATLLGGRFASASLASVAIGSRTLETLMQGGPLTNLAAVLHRLCDHARGQGLEPEVAFYSAHGEANAAAGTSEAKYYEMGLSYYGRAQLLAAQAMRRPHYKAPLVLTYPVQASDNSSGAAIRAIKSAIRQLAEDLPNGVDAGPLYHWPCNNDRIHPTAEGYVLRGEMVGRVLRNFFERGDRWPGVPRIVRVTLDGTAWTAQFSCPITRDDSIGAGQNLNTGTALDGFEWYDNGSPIAITGPLIYGGWTVKGVLASAPLGSIEQQELRLANQLTSAALANGPENLAGSVLRAAGDGWAAVHDPSYVNHLWASPQVFKSVRSA